jgi:hypothetical protein
MIDYIRIKNEGVKLNISRLGDSFNRSKKKDGSINYKFKIYKRKLQIFDPVDDDEDENGYLYEHGKYDSSLIIIANDVSGFTIQGSLRRWWYSATSANADFNFSSFCKCIELIARKLRIEESVLWNSRVSKVEIGANIKLKPKFKNIIGSLESYPRRTRFGDRRQTVYFKTKNNAEEIIIYDKITQLYQREKKINRSVKNKLFKNVFILRFEVVINSPSKTYYKTYINPLKKIRDNWEALIDDWEATFQQINIIYQEYPQLPEGKTYLNRTDLKNYFIQLGIHAYGGIESVELLIGDTASKEKKSQEKAHFRGIANSNIPESFVNFLMELYTSIEGKADQMKGGCYES